MTDIWFMRPSVEEERRTGRFTTRKLVRKKEQEKLQLPCPPGIVRISERSWGRRRNASQGGEGRCELEMERRGFVDLWICLFDAGEGGTEYGNTSPVFLLGASPKAKPAGWGMFRPAPPRTPLSANEIV